MAFVLFWLPQTRRSHQPSRQKPPQARVAKQPSQPQERLRGGLLRGEEPSAKAPDDCRVWGRFRLQIFLCCRPAGSLANLGAVHNVGYFDAERQTFTNPQRPQHDSNPMHGYSSEKEVRDVLVDFGISEELIASHLKLLRVIRMGGSKALRPSRVASLPISSKGTEV
jgi:hypothetical protein